jgi:spermidine synthase
MANVQGKSYLIEQHNGDFGFFVRAGTLVARGKTRFQKFEIYDTPMFGRTLLLDDCFMTSEKDEFFYHENIIHVAATAHAGPRRALIVGGGDGGSAEELLKHNSVEKVVMVELDEGVVDISREYLRGIHGGVFDDPRLETRFMDGKAYVDNTQERFDHIVLDLNDPLGLGLSVFTQDFYRACKRALNPGGIVSLHTENPITRPHTFGSIVHTLRSVFGIVRSYLVYIPIYGTWWSMATASDSLDPAALTQTQVEERIVKRGLDRLQFYNGATHCALFALPNFVRIILGEVTDIITPAFIMRDKIAAAEHALVLEEQGSSR